MRHSTIAIGLVLAACASAPPDDRTDGTPDAGTTGTPDAGTSADPCTEARTAGTDVAAYESTLKCLHSDATEGTKRAAIRGFVALVEGRGGFPIVTATDTTWVYVHDSAYDPGVSEHGGALHVAGEFNAWADGVPLADEGLGFEHVRLPLKPETVAASGAKYKFANGNSLFFADPLARRFQFDNFGEYSLVAGESGKSHLERIRNVHATKLDVDRPIHVYVPAGYESGADRYPVLYMHDGQNLFDPSISTIGAAWEADEVADAEIAAGRANPFLIVGVPNNEHRFEEYTWTEDAIDGPQHVGGKGADYADFLIHDLKPVVDARYRTKAGAADTGIFGSSLGGLISYEIGLAYPEVFKKVGGMSSTFDWGTLGLHEQTVLDRYRASNSLSASGQIFYLDSGGSTDRCPDAGGDNACVTVEMKGILESKGFTKYPVDPSAEHLSPADANILHWVEPGAVHNEAAWHVRLFRVFRFFFGPR